MSPIVQVLAVVLLLALPMYIMYQYGIDFVNKVIALLAVSFGWSLLSALPLFFICRAGSPVWACILYSLALAVVASVAIVRRSRCGGIQLLVPVYAGVVASLVVTGALVATFVVGGESFHACEVLAIGALMLGCLIVTTGDAVATYYMGIKHHRQLYYYLLGNGATHSEAVSLFVRRALTRCVTSFAKYTSVTVAVIPILFWSLMLGPTDVYHAFIMQVVILVASLCASLLSALIALKAAYRFAFDKYSRLMPPANQPKKAKT